MRTCNHVAICGRDPGHLGGHGEFRPILPARAMPHLRGEVLGAPLSPREQDVLQRYATTGHQGTVAADLGLGMRTVKTHLGSAYRKLGVTTGLEAMVVMGWLTIPTPAEVAAYDAAAAFAALRDDLQDLIERSVEFTRGLEAVTDDPGGAP